MNKYSTPSILSHDLSKLHLFQNQATCAVEGNLLVREVDDSCGQVLGANGVQFCFNSSEDISPLLEGLIVTFTDGAEAEQLTNCSAVANDPECQGLGFLYTCDVADGSADNVGCITTLECPDGTTFTCPEAGTGCD